MKKALILLICISIFALPSCKEGGAEPYSVYGIAMDTNVSITVYDEDDKAAADACLELLYGLEAELSVTVSGSKLYALNSGKTIKDDGDFYTICGLANELCLLTEGAYDPCIYPLVKLWGFTTDEYAVPDVEELTRAVELVENSKIVFTDEGIVLENGGMADFGGIAKGYASEVLADYLKNNKVKSAIISLGGNIVTVGTKPNGDNWSIGINSPKGNGSILGVLSVGECAVVTSGSYIRNFTQDGKLYHHIIDPKTGYPADNGLVSVTVVADDAVLADGLSTAFFVMGVEKALTLAKSVGVETVLATNDKIYVSQGLKEKFTLDYSAKGQDQIIYS